MELEIRCIIVEPLYGFADTVLVDDREAIVQSRGFRVSDGIILPLGGTLVRPRGYWEYLVKYADRTTDIMPEMYLEPKP